MKNKKVPGELFDLNRMLKDMVMQSGVNVIFPESKWSPPTDIYETQTEFVVKLDLAGIKPEQVIITIDNKNMIIKGIRTDKSDEIKRCYHQMEIKYGAFEREINVECNTNPNGINASYHNGFLEIRLPKVKRAIKKTITVELEV